jgi:hypothetical protein
MNPSNSPTRPSNELLFLVTIAVGAVVASIAAIALTGHVVFLVLALALLFVALAAVIAEVVKLASDDEDGSRRQAR